MEKSQKKLGIIAGGTGLPKMLIDHCLDTGREFYVLVDGSYVMRIDDAYTLWGEGYVIRDGAMDSHRTSRNRF